MYHAMIGDPESPCIIQFYGLIELMILILVKWNCNSEIHEIRGGETETR